MADVSVSYRPPKPFQSPFVVQPKQGVVEPRSEGAFKASGIDHVPIVEVDVLRMGSVIS